MKRMLVVGALMFGLSMPVFGQDTTSCKIFFQVFRADTRTPERLHLGMDGAPYDMATKGTVKIGPAIDAKLYEEFAALAK